MDFLWVSLSLTDFQKEELLQKPVKGKGGFQSLFRKMKKQVVGNELRLYPPDLEKIERYRSKYGPGGFENRLMGIDFSSLKPANNEFPEE